MVDTSIGLLEAAFPVKSRIVTRVPEYFTEDIRTRAYCPGLRTEVSTNTTDVLLFTIMVGAAIL